jgi:hypothetical protein
MGCESHSREVAPREGLSQAAAVTDRVLDWLSAGKRKAGCVRARVSLCAHIWRARVYF